jgi:hypothetical protein
MSLAPCGLARDSDVAARSTAPTPSRHDKEATMRDDQPRLFNTLRVSSLIVVLTLIVGAAVAFAQTPAAPAAADPLKDLAAKVADAKVALDTVWVMVAASWCSS